MGISLSKGQKISLEKGGEGLNKVFMGLGWAAVGQGQEKPGFFKSLFGGGGGGRDIDLDASVITFDQAKQVKDTIYFNNKFNGNRSIRHSGDDLTGGGAADADNETIYVDLQDLPADVEHLVFTVNSFQGQTFNEVQNSFCRLVDDSDSTETCRYTLSEQGSYTGVVMASVSRKAGKWEMTAHGKPCNGRTVKDIVSDAHSVI